MRSHSLTILPSQITKPTDLFSASDMSESFAIPPPTNLVDDPMDHDLIVPAPSELRRFEFLALPAEVRNMIYKLIIPDIVYFDVSDAMCPYPPSIKDTERLLAPGSSTSGFLSYEIAHHPEKREVRFSTEFHHADELRGAMTLFDSCRTINNDIIPLLGANIVVYIDTLQLAGWFGTIFSDSFAPFIRHVHLEDKPTGSLAMQRRWMSVLLARFPRLEMLRVPLDRTANPGINGSCWTEDSLRMMKFIKETAPELAENIAFRHTYGRRSCGCYRLTDEDEAVHVHFSPNPMPFSFSGHVIDFDKEWQAWRERRRGGVGDLSWGMDKWWQPVNKN